MHNEGYFTGQMIDFHLHIPQRAERSPAELAGEIIAYAEREGLDAVVIHPLAPYHSNDLVARIAEQDPRRIVGFASVVPIPADYAVKELARAVEELGLRGLSLNPPRQGFCLRNPHVWKVIRFAGEELGVPVVLHGPPSVVALEGRPIFAPWLNSPDDYALLPFIAPRVTLVLADPGSAFQYYADLVSSHRNVHLDTSHSFYELAAKYPEALRAIDASKIVFGTGFEVGAVRPLGELVNLINKLFGQRAGEVLSRNARELLGLGSVAGSSKLG